MPIALVLQTLFTPFAPAMAEPQAWEEELPSDPRVIHANSLISDEDTYGKAVGL